MTKKQKLELTWIGKEHRPKLEPRILLEDPEKSYHAAHRVTESDLFDNRLIFGDNLLALKALEAEFAGKVKCAYIDPPFNTGEAFDHYDDGLEHSVWLNMMSHRIHSIYKLLSSDGSLFIHIDDNELAYLIAIGDEIFGRRNRINVITFKQSSASGPKSINPGLVTTNNYIVYYAKNKENWTPNKIYSRTSRDPRYSRFIDNFEDGEKKWNLISLKDAFLRFHEIDSWDLAKAAFADRIEAKMEDFVLNNAERVVRTARVAEKDVNEFAREALKLSKKEKDTVFRSERDGKSDYYFLNGEQLIFYISKTRVIDGGLYTAIPLTNLWDDLLSNNLHKEGGVRFRNGKKPEALIKRCLELSTAPEDLVLDSFAGSGTTGAVAHKMGRRWIMVELGEHCHTHAVPRLKRVVNGLDDSGITKAMNWKGGGGFRYYKLAPSLLKQDKWGRWVINPEFNAEMLAEALCKLKGFTYAPSDTLYWQHGYSTERDFIYVTTQNLSHDQLAQLADEVGTDRTLLVLCKAFRGRPNFPNLTIKKIPKDVRDRCEWDHDDYSLQVENLPKAPPELIEDAPEPPPSPTNEVQQFTLF